MNIEPPPIQPSDEKAPLNIHTALPLIVDELPLGIAAMDHERRIVLLNRSMEALTGYSRDEAKRVPCRHIVRADFCMGKCPVLSMSQGSGMMCVEGNIVNRERQKIPVRVTFTPIRDAQGQLIGYFETFEDIRILVAQTEKASEAFRFGQLVGRSPQMEQIYRFLPMIAQSDSSVLLTGETGTGKDLVAEAIHQGSPRAKGPFVKVNCGALPATLLESELFGHQKGAFTGAIENKPGRFRLAHNGTLYLAEIGDLPLPLQVKLLTFLDDQIVHPLGSIKGFLCDVRVIAATHRDLERMVKEGTFRADLLFRLNVVRLEMPPLRDRKDDVQLLLYHFLQIFSSKFKKPIRGFSSNALRTLLIYTFPGNIRELKNIVEYASNVCQENQIRAEHLPAYLTNPISLNLSSNYITDSPLSSFFGRLSGNRDDLDRSTVERDMILNSILNSQEKQKNDLEWPAIERKMILDTLIKTQGRRNKAAALLGWSRSKLYRKMQLYKAHK